MMRSLGMVCLLVTCSLFSAPVAAQISSGGSIRGHVKDEQDAVLPGTKLTAASPDAPGSYSATSDEDGYYRLLDLPPGEYTVTAELDGFAKWVRERLVVSSGLNITVPVILRIGALTELVQVRLESPLLESVRPVTALNVQGETQRSMPLGTRQRWTDALKLAPNVIENVNSPGTYFLHGTSPNSHVFQLEGVDAMSTIQNTSRYMNLGVDAIADVEIKTAGLDASVPLGLGVVANVASRSGTDRFSGVVGLTRQPMQWNSTNNPGGTSSQLDIWHGDASVGGPVRPGSAWFFTSYRHARYTVGIPRDAVMLGLMQASFPNAEIASRNTERGNFMLTKGTVNLVDGHILTALYSHDRTTRSDISASELSETMTTLQGGPLYGVKVSSQWTGAFSSEFLASYNEKGLDREPFRDDVPGRTLFSSTIAAGGRLQGAGAIATFDNTTFGSLAFPASKTTLGFDAVYFGHGIGGSHEVRVGTFWQPKLHDEWTTKYHANGFVLEEVVLRDARNPTAGYVPFHRRIYDTSLLTTRLQDSRDFAIYAQDRWVLGDRVTASAGLRVDWIKRTDRLLDLVTQRSVEIGPRLGVVVVMDGARRHSLRGTWSRVHENLSVNNATTTSTIAGFRDVYDLNLDGVFDAEFVTPGLTNGGNDLVFDVDRFHQAYADETTAGYRAQWPGRVVTDVGVVHRKYRDLPTGIETNAIYSGSVFQGLKNEALNEIYLITPNIWNWPTLTALEARVTKQTERIMLAGGYTRQWRHVSGTWQPNDPASFIQPGAFDNDKGIGMAQGNFGFAAANSLSGNNMTNSPGWRDHTGTIGGSYRGPWNVQLAGYYSVKSGLWSGPIVTRLPAADPAFGPASIRTSGGRVVSNPLATPIRFAFGTRGDGQFQSATVYQLDVRAGWRYTVKSKTIDLALDVFNVTNNDADDLLVNGANQQYNLQYRRRASRQPPRAAQVVIRVSF